VAGARNRRQARRVLYASGMKTLLATLLLALLSTTACVSPDRELPSRAASTVPECDPATVSRPDLEQLEVRPDGSLAEVEPAGDFDAPSDQVIAEGFDLDACSCQDDGCVVDWIDENLGCGVCATVMCADGPVGGCLPCLEPLDEAPAADTAGEPCLLPPSDQIAR
jgi:hypothetical protein